MFSLFTVFFFIIYSSSYDSKQNNDAKLAAYLEKENATMSDIDQIEKESEIPESNAPTATTNAPTTAATTTSSSDDDLITSAIADDNETVDTTATASEKTTTSSKDDEVATTADDIIETSIDTTTAATATATEEPTATETPEVHDTHDYIYACDAEDCSLCPNDNEAFDNEKEIMVKFGELDGLLKRNQMQSIRVYICGSTKENHPIVDHAFVKGKQIEFRGKNEAQFIEFGETSAEGDAAAAISLISLYSKDVTIISKTVKNFKTNFIDLKRSPLDVENVYLTNFGNSDVKSLSLAKTVSFDGEVTIADKGIAKMIVGSDSLELSYKGSDSISANITSSHSEHVAYVETDETDVKFSVVPGTTKVNGNLKFEFIVFDDDFEDDFDNALKIKNEANTVTITLDDSWQTITNTDFLVIDHNEYHLILNGPQIVKKIAVIGEGKVTRNGVDDPIATEVPTKPTDFPKDTPSKSGLTAGVVITIIVVAGISLVVGFIVYKKCKGKKKTQYGEYLNNTNDLDPIEPI